MDHHCSWNEANTNVTGIIMENHIPEYNINDVCYKEMYENFYNKYGCMIIKGVFENQTMDDYDTWCDDIYCQIKNDQNINHSIQKDKILYNNIVERMGKTNPILLHSLLGHHKLNKILDNLLGFTRIGSCTGHKVLGGGDRQETHVDYPIHLNSSKFWKDDGGIDKLKRMITKYQLNYILPYFSIQALTAVCDMNKMNGSTEVVPCSHLIEDIDMKIHNQEFREEIEKKFINVELKKGDVLLFNRRLCHRGGKNESNEDRNALITQYVWSWGVGQEVIDHTHFFDYLDSIEMDDEEKKILKLRFKFEYPIDVSQRS